MNPGLQSMTERACHSDSITFISLVKTRVPVSIPCVGFSEELFIPLMQEKQLIRYAVITLEQRSKDSNALSIMYGMVS